MFRQAFSSSTVVIATLLLVSGGCQSNGEVQPEATPTEDRVSETEEESPQGTAVDRETESEHADPLEDGRQPRFTIGGNPHREELHRPQITATEAVELTLHEKPDASSPVVGRIRVETDEEIAITGESKMLIFTDVEELPDRVIVSAIDDRAEQIELEAGKQVSYFLQYGGEGTYIGHLWYEGQTHRILPSERLNDLFDTELLQSEAGFDFDRDQWWIETEGSDAQGWLLANGDGLQSRGVMLEEYR